MAMSGSLLYTCAYIDYVMQKTHNSNVFAIELRLFCITLSICYNIYVIAGDMKEWNNVYFVRIYDFNFVYCMPFLWLQQLSFECNNVLDSVVFR